MKCRKFLYVGILSIYIVLLVGCQSEDYYESVAKIQGEDFYLSGESINMISQFEESLEKSYINSYDEYLEEGLIESEIKDKRRERFRILKDYEIHQAIYQDLILRDALESGKLKKEELDRMSAKDREGFIRDHQNSLKKKIGISEMDIDGYIEENKGSLDYVDVLKLTFNNREEAERFYHDFMDDDLRGDLLELVNRIDEENEKEKEEIISSIKKFKNYKIKSSLLVSFFKKESEIDWVFIPFGNKFNRQVEEGVVGLGLGEISRPIKLEKNWALGFTQEIFIKRDIDYSSQDMRARIRDLMERENLNNLLKGFWDEYEVEIIL